MATTYTFPTFNDPAMARPQAGVHQRIVKFTPTTGVINDIFKVAKLPKGAKLSPGWYLEVPDLDTNATPTLTISVKVTDGTTTKTVIAAATTGQAGGVAYDSTATVGQQTGWANFKTTNDDFYVYVTWAAAAATFASGACLLGFSYLLDAEAGGSDTNL